MNEKKNRMYCTKNKQRELTKLGRGYRFFTSTFCRSIEIPIACGTRVSHLWMCFCTRTHIKCATGIFKAFMHTHVCVCRLFPSLFTISQVDIQPFGKYHLNFFFVDDNNSSGCLSYIANETHIRSIIKKTTDPTNTMGHAHALSTLHLRPTYTTI